MLARKQYFNAEIVRFLKEVAFIVALLSKSGNVALVVFAAIVIACVFCIAKSNTHIEKRIRAKFNTGARLRKVRPGIKPHQR